MNEDFLDFLRALVGAGARFLVVGAHALAVHGVPRATGDLDVWIDATPENASRVWTALLEFGAPVEDVGLVPEDLRQPDRVVQLGVPPRRIDVMTELSGIEFADAWEGRSVHEVESIRVPFIGRTEFVKNKRATGRRKDLADLERLGEL